MYEKTVLENGTTFISYSMSQRDSVGLGIWVKAGSRFENRTNQGIAHFLEHLLFKGSKNYSCRQIKEEIEGVGGTLNGFTSEEFCCYFVKIPSKYLKLALEILLDMVLNPLLLKEDIDKEKNVIKEEIKLYHDLPQNYVRQVLDEILWPNHPLGRSILGTYKTIEQIDQRELFLFKERFYVTSNIVIAACGNLEHKVVVKEIRKILDSVVPNKTKGFKRVDICQERFKLKIVKREIEQTHLALGFHSLNRQDPRRYTLALLHVILGANMSSRLFNKVREEKGLAYDIGTHVQFFLDSGAFIIHAGVDNRKLKIAIKVILKELERITKSPPTHRELRRAKDYYLGQLSISLEDTLEHMFWIGESTITLNKAYTFKEIEEEVGCIERREIMLLAQEIFLPEKIRLAIVGPLQESEEELSRYILKL